MTTCELPLVMVTPSVDSRTVSVYPFRNETLCVTEIRRAGAQSAAGCSAVADAIYRRPGRWPDARHWGPQCHIHQVHVLRLVPFISIFYKCGFRRLVVHHFQKIISALICNQILVNLIPIDSSWDALHFVFWVQEDQVKRLTANPRNRSCGCARHLQSPFFVEFGGRTLHLIELGPKAFR